IAADPRNAHVLFPYLNGEDLNSRPDSSPSRWVIDFNDWPLEKAERYPDILGLVAARVRPERQRKKPNGEYVLRRPLPERWWQYADKRPAMRRAIVDLSEVLVIAQVSRTLMPVRVPNGQIFDAKLIVFSSESFADQAVLSSTMHQLWAIRYGTTMRTDPTYTPSTCFDTFARPEPSERLHEIGQALDQTRREVMLRRALGLTKLYNLVNDPDIAVSADEDVARLRQIHVDLDEAVMAAYGWSEVLLEHGFHTYRQMQRWTVSPTARVEILDRLLEENHRRAALQGGAPPSSLAADEGDDE
ncbi:MAG: type IIL restriction-modification enzyme MmeI, partial [Streptosporangiaceae bacterium]